MASNEFPDDCSSDDASAKLGDSEMDIPSLRPQVHWDIMDIPEEVDKTGKVVKWSSTLLHSVEPYVDPNQTTRTGGSGILDTEPATHLYISPRVLRDAPEINPDLLEQRRWYHTEIIDHLVESESKSDDESDVGSNEKNNIKGPGSTSPRTQICSDSLLNITNVLATEWTKFVSNPKQPSIITTVGKPIVSPASTSSSNPSYHMFNLDDLWNNLQASVTGDGLPEDESPNEFSRMPFSAHSPVIQSEPLEDIPEPDLEKPSRPRQEIIVTFDETSTVSFQPLMKRILVKHAGQKTIQHRLTVANVAKVFFQIMRSYRIRKVEPIGLSPNYDIDWVRHNARAGLIGNRPSFEFYTNIQDMAIGSDFYIRHAIVAFIYYPSPVYISDLAKHCLLRFPLATPINPPLEQTHNGVQEDSTDSVFRHQTAERNLTISQLVKRVYIDSKREEASRRLAWLRCWGPVRPYLERYQAIDEEAAMVDDWEQCEHVECPRNWDHSGARGGPEFDLQNIDWERKVGVSKEDMLYLRHHTYKAWDNIGGLEAMRRSSMVCSF
jgi:hypothetical protein